MTVCCAGGSCTHGVVFTNEKIVSDQLLLKAAKNISYQNVLPWQAFDENYRKTFTAENISKKFALSEPLPR